MATLGLAADQAAAEIRVKSDVVLCNDRLERPQR